MKSTHWMAAAVAMALIAGVWAAEKITRMQVQVRQTELRETPTALGKIVGTLKYGDRVEMIEQNDAGWLKVRGGEGSAVDSGWIRASVLTEQKIKIKAGKNAQLKASSEEVALAGKGISEVEKHDLKKNPRLKSPYQHLDRMEREPLYQVGNDQATAFLQTGQLVPQGPLAAKGGAK